MNKPIEHPIPNFLRFSWPSYECGVNIRSKPFV